MKLSWPLMWILFAAAGAGTAAVAAADPSAGGSAATNTAPSAGNATAGSTTKQGEAMTGEQILAAMDKNRDYQGISYSSTMRIIVGKEVRSKAMKVVAKTEGRKAVVEFTNPEDKGTRYLMLGDNLWIYFPDEDDVVKISGHLLKEGMMGSDVSYEDALSADTLSSKYNITVTGSETLNGHDCYVITLDAKVKDVPYAKRKMWVDKEYFLSWKQEMYARSGKLLKTSTVLEVANISGRHFPVKVEMSDQLKKNSKTELETREVVFDQPMDDKQFSQQYLRR